MTSVLKAEASPKNVPFDRLARASASPCLDPYSCHPRADGLTHRDPVGLEATQAEDVYSEMIGGDALAMKRVDPTRLAEEVASRHRMESIFGKGVLTGQQLEPGLVDFHHQGVLAATD